MNFIKMHGCGNDYIYFDCFDFEIKDPNVLAIKLSDRHKGIGGDGIVMILKSNIADAKMRMFNIDGSEGKMCGNAIRCVAKYIYENKTQKNIIEIETLSGLKKCFIKPNNGVVDMVTVDMGKPIIEPVKIPVNIADPINKEIVINNTKYYITCVSMGNPHCVIFTENIDEIPLEKIGPMFEENALFPEGINTEFVEVISKNLFKMRVWERGSGETFACGTGACATVVAGILNKHCMIDEDVVVMLKGGNLTIKANLEKVYMTGEAVKVFEGSVNIEN